MRISITLIAFFALAIALFGLATVAQAHGLFVFPNDGQSQDQQDKDEFQCIRIARDQSGFNPMATPTATQARPETRGGALRGAAGGALLGTAVGAIGGNTRRGAVAGAAGGGLIGGMRRNDSRRQQDNWAQEQTASYQADRDRWNRAFTGCMQSRGYTVN